MEVELAANQKKMPLRIIAPDVYDALIKTLADFHIHPFDVKADAIKQGNGLLVIIHYGQAFGQAESQFFSNDALKRPDNEITDFFNDIKEACQRTMKSDYFATMNPAMNKKAK